MNEPRCGKCGKVMTPADSRIHPEWFLHDACLPEEFSNRPQDFNYRDRVIYVPMHAEGNIAHRDCEHGAVSSVNEKFVFVKFDNDVKKFGWDGATTQACLPAELVRVPEISEGE